MEKSVSRLAKGIIKSVQNGAEDQKIRDDIESCSASEITQLIDILKGHQPLLSQSQSSARVLFSYWLLFIRLSGREIIKCSAWDSYIMQNITSPNLTVTSSLFALLKVCFGRMIFIYSFFSLIFDFRKLLGRILKWQYVCWNIIFVKGQEFQ